MRKENMVLTEEGEWTMNTWLSSSREEKPTGPEVKEKDIAEENSDEPMRLFQANSHINNSEMYFSSAFPEREKTQLYAPIKI